MTISSATRKAGPFVGNGATTAFPFAFKVFEKADVKVLRVDSNGVAQTLVLDSDYSVSLSSNQDSTPGGTVNYPLSGAAMTSAYSLVLLGNLPYDQQIDITNQGGFYPNTVEDMVDRSTIQIQQLVEVTSRAIVVSEAENLNPVLPNAQGRANTALGFDDNGNVTLLPFTSSFGAGDLRTDVFRASSGDFTPGTTIQLTLSRNPGTADNVFVWWDGVPQFDFTLSGTKITFNEPIYFGTSVIRVRTGTTLSQSIPSLSEEIAQLNDDVDAINTSIASIDTTLGNFSAAFLARVQQLGTVANLRATSTGQIAFCTVVAGYYTPNDGGGGVYVLDAGDVSTADNGGSVIVNTSGQRFKLAGPPDWYVEQFGAKGDGVTDDAPAINAALAALPARGGTVRMRGKTYGIKSTIKIGNGNGGSTPSTINGIRFIGQGGGSGFYSQKPTMLQVVDTGTTMPYIDNAVQVCGPIDSVNLDGFGIYCKGVNGALANTSLYMKAFNGSTVRNVHAAFHKVFGLQVIGGDAPVGNYNTFNEFHQCSFTSTYDGHIGLLMDGNYSGGNDTWISSFYNCRFDTNSALNAIAGYFKFIDSCNFHRCHFVGNNTSGVPMSGSIGAYFNAVGNPGFPCGMHFDFCSILSTWVNENTTDKIRQITFCGYGTFDNEIIPTHPKLIGYTDAGVRFNGWGA